MGSRIRNTLLGCLAMPVAAAQTYTVADLDPAGTLGAGAAFAVTRDGALAVGLGDGHATAFDGAGVTLLPALPGDDGGHAYDVARVGGATLIVGSTADIVSMGHLLKIFDHPVLWQNGQATDLRTLVSGGANLELLVATGIDADGRICGWARDPATSTSRAFLFDGGMVSDLGVLQSTPLVGATANAIHESGRVVGWSEANGGFDHAVLWENGQIHDLHDPNQVPGRVSEAFDVNRFGVIAGAADFGADFLDYKTATVWENGVATNLGTLAGPGAQPVIESWARAVNDLGVIVGTSVTANFEVHAVIWKDGQIHDLNSLIPPGTGWLLANAHDVADDGRIVGEGFLNGQLRPFVLVPQCDGAFLAYGTACPTGSGASPSLAGLGCPTPGETFAIDLRDGPPNAAGLLFLGTGNGTLNVVPTCALQIAPLLPIQVPLALDAEGGLFLEVNLPAGTASFDVRVQALLADPSAFSGLTATQALGLHFQ